MILIRLNADNKVTAQWNQEDDQAHPEENLLDVTNHPDGPNFMGRTQLPNGSFTPFISPPKTRREELKEKQNWTVADRNEAIKLLL